MHVIETERLLLRHLQPQDLDDLYALYRDPEIRRWFPDGTRTREQTREELNHFARGIPGHPELGLWATLHKPSGQFIGRCGLLPWTIEQQQEVEVAFLLAEPYWGQGLATEAARAIAAHAFEGLHLPRLICLVTPGTRRPAGLQAASACAWKNKSWMSTALRWCTPCLPPRHGGQRRVRNRGQRTNRRGDQRSGERFEVDDSSSTAGNSSCSLNQSRRSRRIGDAVIGCSDA
jgi:RimJ/RimL family protein N-acetyltransferase